MLMKGGSAENQFHSVDLDYNIHWFLDHYKQQRLNIFFLEHFLVMYG